MSMTRFFKLIFLLVGMVFVSCSTSSESEKSSNSIVLTEKQKVQMAAWEELSPTARKILGSYQGIVRDKKWGQLLDSIHENLDKSESQPVNGVSFTQYLDQSDLNFVDISYVGSNGKLAEIKFDIFLEEGDEVKSLINELKSYLTILNGNAESSQSKITWKNEKTRIILEDVSTSKDPGLQLLFKLEN
jgi:hypothetical protein